MVEDNIGVEVGSVLSYYHIHVPRVGRYHFQVDYSRSQPIGERECFQALLSHLLDS